MVILYFCISCPIWLIINVFIELFHSLLAFSLLVREGLESVGEGVRVSQFQKYGKYYDLQRKYKKTTRVNLFGFYW